MTDIILKNQAPPSYPIVEFLKVEREAETSSSRSSSVETASNLDSEDRHCLILRFKVNFIVKVASGDSKASFSYAAISPDWCWLHHCFSASPLFTQHMLIQHCSMPLSSSSLSLCFVSLCSLIYFLFSLPSHPTCHGFPLPTILKCLLTGSCLIVGVSFSNLLLYK